MSIGLPCIEHEIMRLREREGQGAFDLDDEWRVKLAPHPGFSIASVEILKLRIGALPKLPVHRSHCADCGHGTLALGEYYMVKDEVWEKAWANRRKPWHELFGLDILCIGCLERRLGRTLTPCDFTDAPINKLSKNMSDRLRDRLSNEISCDSGTGDAPAI
jgi:hypothetical protein